MKPFLQQKGASLDGTCLVSMTILFDVVLICVSSKGGLFVKIEVSRIAVFVSFTNCGKCGPLHTFIYIHTYLPQTPEIGQGLGRFLSCGARKQEQT